MVNSPSNNPPLRYLRYGIIITTVFFIGGCKEIHLYTDMNPKQGDLVLVKVEADDAADLKEVVVEVNGVEKDIPDVPYFFFVDTCKDTTGEYMTNLHLSAEAKWEGGDTDTTGKNIPLTASSIWREDDKYGEYGALEYGVYLAYSERWQDEVVVQLNANSFINGFHGCGDINSSYPYLRTQHLWVEPDCYMDKAHWYVNNVDLAISFGHGKPHVFATYYKGPGGSNSDTVDLSTTEFGAFKPCHVWHSDVSSTGDLEYLIFVSSRTLSMADTGANSFWYYWFHNDSTKMGPRPFTGLHMALGYSGIRNVEYAYNDDDEIIWNSGDCHMLSFGYYLYTGMEVIEAWQLASLDGQSFAPGSDENFTAVFYLKSYEGDNIFTTKGDRIYPSYGGTRRNYMYW